MSLHRACCCGPGEPEPPLEDCPLTLFDFPAGCFSPTEFRIAASGVELKVCDNGVTCTETVGISTDVVLSDVWQVATAAISTGGTNWTASDVYAACMPTTWLDHPDGSSDFIYLAIEFRYDASGNPCGLDAVAAGNNAYDFTLFVVSDSPRTATNACIPTGGYTAFGWRIGINQQLIEPNREVGDCADFDACDGGDPAPGECVASVGSVAVTRL